MLHSHVLLWLPWRRVHYSYKNINFQHTTTTKSATAEHWQDYSKLFDRTSVLLTPDWSLHQRLTLRYQLMLILVVLYLYGRGLARKGWVCVLGGRDAFNRAYPPCSYFISNSRQISIKIFLGGVVCQETIKATRNMRVYQPFIDLVRVEARVQVSPLRRRTDSTVALKNDSFTPLDILDFQIFMSFSTFEALPFLAFLLFSVEAMRDPKYLKSRTSRSSFPSIVLSRVSKLELYLITSVFFGLSCWPAFSDWDSVSVSGFCTWSTPLDKSAMSLAKSRSVSVIEGLRRDFLWMIVNPSSSSLPLNLVILHNFRKFEKNPQLPFDFSDH